jgi:hypothetical protein
MPGAGRMKKIFISCASKDRKAALTLCAAIEARGFPCWISSRDVGPGENFQEAIVRAIRNAGLMVLVFSANANNSDEIKKEVALAGQGRLAVLPVRIEDVMPSEALSYEFATRQWIDVFDDWERAIQQLLSHIANLLPGAEAVSPAMPQTIAPRQRGGKNLVYGAALLMLLAALGGWWLLRSKPVSPVKPLPVIARKAPQPQTPSLQKTAPQTKTVSSDPAQLELAYWQSIRDSSDPADFRAYLRQYPHGAFVSLAHARLARETLAAAPKKAAPPVASAQPAPAPAPAETSVARTEPAAPTASFDGHWAVTVTCPKSPDGAQGYSYDFVAEMKDGALHGERGTSGAPGWFSLDGHVRADGAATMEANGIVGRNGYAINHMGAGFAYHHVVIAHFDGDQGSGSWVTERVCNFTFRKM